MRSKAKSRQLNGYLVVYEPTHPKAMTSRNWKGYVYEHIVIVEKKLGRSLVLEEVVHHLDENRGNNSPDNLVCCQRDEHTRMHNAKRPIKRFIGRSTAPTSGLCRCGKQLRTTKAKYCSKECYSLACRRSERPSKEYLRELLRNLAFTAIAAMYSVSDNCIRKWARGYGII